MSEAAAMAGEPSRTGEATAAAPGGAADFLAMPGHLLRRCQQIGVAVFLDECGAFDLTPLQFGALAALDRFGPLDQARLGGVTALDRTTVIVVLTRLEERGLVTRGASDRDRRARIAAITEAGRRIVQEVMPHVVRAQERMLAPLTPRERGRMLALLAKMADANNDLSRAPHRLP